MIDWEKVKYYNPERDQFSENPDEYAEPELIYTLDKFRSMVKIPLRPSRIDGSLARFEGHEQSRHYAIDRLSDAIKVCPDGSLRKTWLVAICSGLWGGVGLYPYLKNQGISEPTLHLDLRPVAEGNSHRYTIIWFKDIDGEHYFPQFEKRAEGRLFNILNSIG